jgi:hypothetical protein
LRRTHRHSHYITCNPFDTRQGRCTTRQHHACGKQTIIPGAFHFLHDQAKSFFDAGFDNMCQILTIDLHIVVFTKGANGEKLLDSNFGTNGIALLFLYFLCLR